MSVDTPDTKALLHFNGADESTTIVDETGRSWTAYDGAKLDDAQKKFGSTALYLDGVNDYISTADHADLQLGLTFTVDFWLYSAANTGVNYRGIIDKWVSNDGFMMYFPTAGSGILTATVGNASVSSTTQLCDSTWRHIALVGDGTNMRLFINGTQEGATTSIAGKNNVASGHAVYVGGDGVSTTKTNNAIRIDELRIIKGVAVWTANFTPPTEEYHARSGRILSF